MNKRKITKWVAASIATTTLVAIGSQLLPSPRNATADETNTNAPSATQTTKPGNFAPSESFSDSKARVFAAPAETPNRLEGNPLDPKVPIYPASPSQPSGVYAFPGTAVPGTVQTRSNNILQTIIDENGIPRPVMVSVSQFITSDGKRFDDIETANIHEETLKLTARNRQEKDADAKASIRESLVEAITKEYDALRAVRLKEIDELEKKLADVKANLAKRDEVKDKIIERHVEQLLGVDPLYQWDATPVQAEYAQPANQVQIYGQTQSPFRNDPNQRYPGTGFGPSAHEALPPSNVAYPSWERPALQNNVQSVSPPMLSSDIPNSNPALSGRSRSSAFEPEAMKMPSFRAPEQRLTVDQLNSLQPVLEYLESQLESSKDEKEKELLRSKIQTLRKLVPKA